MPIRLVPAVLVALVLLGGCSYGAEATPPQERPLGPATTVATPDPTSWLGQVCTALIPAARIGTPPPTEPAALAASRDRLLTYIDDRSRVVDTAIAQVNAAGPAPLENGQAATATVVDLLRARQSALAQSRDALAAIPANAEQALASGIEGARARLVTPAPRTLGDVGLPTVLADEAAAVPSCRMLIGA